MRTTIRDISIGMQEWVVSVSLSGTNKNSTSNTSSTRRVSRSRGGIGRVRPQRGSFTTIRPSSRPSRKQKWIVCIGTDCRDKVTASSSTGRRTRSRRGSTSSRAERRIVCPIIGSPCGSKLAHMRGAKKGASWHLGRPCNFGTKMLT